VRVALGLKAHCGWAVLVALGEEDGRLRVCDRRRLELAPGDAGWAKQPYHAAESLRGDPAREMVQRGVASARRRAGREVAAAVKRLAEAGHEPVAGAVLTAAPMPPWSVEEILAVHFRMHKAEGALFRDALSRATDACGLRPAHVLEKGLLERAAERLGRPTGELEMILTRLGRDVGSPWGKDQKNAALAAWMALSES